MDKIKIIISDIKSFFNDVNKDKETILNYIKKKQELEIEKNGFSNKDLEFLIELTINNIDLSEDILKDIFLNSKNKVQQKILISVSNGPNNNTLNLDNKVDTQVLNLISSLGTIYISPKKIYLLWNNKVSDLASRQSSLLDTIDIKLINYDVFLERSESLDNTSFLSEITNRYVRNFGIDEKQGFKTRYQLIIPIENDNTFVTIEDACTGICDIYIEGEHLVFKLETQSDIYNMISKLKKILISVFSKDNTKIINHIKLFFTNKNLYPYINIIFESLKKEKVLIPKQKIKKFIYVDKEQTNTFLNEIFMSEPCDHVEEYKKVYMSGDYFNKVNEFINNYINYEDGRAVCVLCNESIKELNIQASFYIDKEKFITTPDSILFYPPYNKFNNLKFFMDNLFYIFSLNTKMGIYNSTLVTRILVDNLILVSSNRIDLEVKYKQDIIDNNIFLLRLTNNFFETYDLEKERYKEKRTLFTNIPAYIIIFVTSTLSDYYDFFLLKKVIKLNSINSTWSLITFEDVMAHIIDLILKKTKIEETYLDLTLSLRIKKIKRIIQIYYEIFNDEFKLMYKEKKILLENYLKRLSEQTNVYKIERIGNFIDGVFASEFNSLRQYILNVFSIDMIKPERLLKHYKNLYIGLEDVNKNINLETIHVKNFNVDKTFFNKKDNVLNLDLFEIDNKENTKDELEELDVVYSEFLKEKYYMYDKTKYTIIKTGDFFVLISVSEKEKIQFKDSDFLDIQSLNHYSNKDLVEEDIFLYITDINLTHFDYILRMFFIFINKKYKITINSNISKFIKKVFKNRKELFLLKIKILNLIEKLKILNQ